MNEQGKETVIPDEEIDREIEHQDQSDQDQEEAIETEVENEELTEEKDPADLLKELDKVSAEKSQLADRMLRLQAEFDNYKRRTEKEKIAERKYKAQDIATELLPVIDNFERALQTEVSDDNKGFLEGMEMIYQQLQTVLESQGIEKIETVDKEFDPNLHHAVMQVEDDDKNSNIVVEELQKGYMLKDKVIRPAMVKVNK